MIEVGNYLNRLSTDLTSAEYHGLVGSYSSSQLKTMLEDPEKFYKKYITKELAKEEGGAHFDVGTYFHTAVLEPEKLDEECVVYTGGIRSGKKWEDFKALHAGKAIITNSDLIVADRLIAGVKASKIAMAYLEGAECEISAFMKIYVFKGEIFAFRDQVVLESAGEIAEDCYVLTAHGWAQDSLSFDEENIKDFGFPLIIKVRADALNRKQMNISDLKSTKSNVNLESEMQKAVDQYNYDMSASLYLDIFSFVCRETFKEFIWIYANKETGACQNWVQDGESQIVGRAMWRHAVLLIAKNSKKKWKFEDEARMLPPSPWKRHWLTKI